MVAITATKWASISEIEAAWVAWPRGISDETHIITIMAETGLGPNAARECLFISRGQSEGDCIEID